MLPDEESFNPLDIESSSAFFLLCIYYVVIDNPNRGELWNKSPEIGGIYVFRLPFVSVQMNKWEFVGLE